MAVVVDDHVHLGDAGELLVDLDPEDIFLCEVVPVGVVVAALRGVRREPGEPASGLAADVVKRVQEESAGAASRIENEVFLFWIEDLDRKANELARGEVLPE